MNEFTLANPMTTYGTQISCTKRISKVSRKKSDLKKGVDWIVNHINEIEIIWNQNKATECSE